MTRPLMIAMLLGLSTPAFGQDVWGGRGRAGVSVGVQPGAGALAETTTGVDYLEPTPITADLSGANAPFFDLQVALRLSGPLGLGFGVSGLNITGDAHVTAAIPHPFYFERPRNIEGTAPDVTRREAAVHMGLAYLARASDRADLTFYGGLSYFRVQQDLVSDVTYSESFPFDTAAFSTAQIVEETASKVGYHAGVDITWKLTPRWGVGGLLRFSRARPAFELDEAEVATIDAGGFQAGAGLRLIF